jgi:hypothetical protein
MIKSRDNIKKSIEVFKRLNNEAKDFIKTGEFRQLSDKLVEINKKIVKTTQIFSSDFEKTLLSIEECYSIEYEILRYKLFVFQHLSYYDALNQEKNRVIARLLEDDNLNRLFDNLNELNQSQIVSVKSLETDAEIAFREIISNNEPDHIWRNKTSMEKKVWQEKVWLVLCNENEQFHMDKFEDSLRKLQHLKDFVFEKLADLDDDTLNAASKSNRNYMPLFCYTTKATIIALIGNCQSMKGQLHEAEESYYEAIKLYTSKANNPKDISGRESWDEKRIKNILFQFRRSAQIFLYGLLKVHSKTSNISRCKASVAIAELLLTNQKNDETSFIVINFAKATIERIEAGTNLDKLRQAKDNILDVKRKLEILDHNPLLAEVNFELAILSHLLNKWDLAETLLKEVEKFYDETLFRMKANIAILRSHIERAKGQFNRSLDFAKQALTYSKITNNVVVEIDAKICLAESYFALRKSKADVKNQIIENEYELFQQALEMNSQMGSPKIEAICLLGLCKVSAFRNDKVNAEYFFEKFVNIKQFCQHQFVLDFLLEQAEFEMKSFNNKSFIISENENLNFEQHLENLKYWLYSKAEESSKTDEEIGKKLNISRQSVIAWRKNLELNEKNKKS